MRNLASKLGLKFHPKIESRSCWNLTGLLSTHSHHPLSGLPFPHFHIRRGIKFEVIRSLANFVTRVVHSTSRAQHPPGDCPWNDEVVSSRCFKSWALTRPLSCPWHEEWSKFSYIHAPNQKLCLIQAPQSARRFGQSRLYWSSLEWWKQQCHLAFVPLTRGCGT